MPVKVKVFEAVRVLPSAMVRVALVAGAVRVSLLMVVAEATPRAGVTKVGEVANTKAPVPVSFVKEVSSCREVMESVAVP